MTRNSPLRKTLIVARWEYLERVKSKVFLFSLVIMPLIMISMGLIPGLMVETDGDRTRLIGVTDLTGKLLHRFAGALEDIRNQGSGNPLYIIRPIDPVNPDLVQIRERGDELVARGEIDGFCILMDLESGGYRAEFRSANVTEFLAAGRIRESFHKIVLEDTLSELGVDRSILRWVDSSVEVRMVKLSQIGEEEGYGEEQFVQTFFSAYVFLMMLFFMILSSGQLLVRSVIEEKMNRIVEVLISSCSPTQLMAGKVLGLSGLGFTQMIVWGTIAVIVSSFLSFDIIAHEHAFLLLLYFVLGYLFYAAIFIAIGSPVTTEQEAQAVTSYLVMILVIPLVLTVPAIQNPDAEWISILSYVPLLTPTMMGLRLSVGTPAVTEILLTVVVMVVSIYFAMVAAGRIFRVAILSTGKRPSLKEIVSWAVSRTE